MCAHKGAAVHIPQLTYMQYFSATLVNAHCTCLVSRIHAPIITQTVPNILQRPEHSSNTCTCINYLQITNAAGYTVQGCELVYAYTKYHLHFFVHVNTHVRT